jgi:hypothetical protein
LSKNLYHLRALSRGLGGDEVGGLVAYSAVLSLRKPYVKLRVIKKSLRKSEPGASFFANPAMVRKNRWCGRYAKTELKVILITTEDEHILF